ncbi:MAG: aminotransferase class IV [Cytophagales bacterium]|nr:aminotransferase class IV [Cytophagales bacterium]
MSRLIESIYLKDGEFRNLKYHQLRVESSSKELFGVSNKWTLENKLQSSEYPESGLYKVRVIYDTEVRQIEFVPYLTKPVQSLKLISSDTISYAHKFENRQTLNELYQQREGCDDIIIVRSGFVTDASYANLIFRKGDEWFTPATFLLAGTMRAFLLDSNQIKSTEIRVEDVVKYESCKLINAMLGMDAPEIPLSSIV